CDRVLWKSQPALSKDVMCTEYTSHPQLRTSDHKPVSATFSIRCRSLPPVKKSGTTRVKFSGVSGSDLLVCGHITIEGLALSGKAMLLGMQGMDVSGLSDVYLMFYTFPDILQSKKGTPKSRTKNQTLNPVGAFSD